MVTKKILSHGLDFGSLQHCIMLLWSIIYSLLTKTIRGVWDRTHLVSFQPFQYNICCISGNLSPERVLFLFISLVLQHCPEGLSQLQSLEGRVCRWGRGLLLSVLWGLVPLAIWLCEITEQPFTNFTFQKKQYEIIYHSYSIASLFVGHQYWEYHWPRVTDRQQNSSWINLLMAPLCSSVAYWI